MLRCPRARLLCRPAVTSWSCQLARNRTCHRVPHRALPAANDEPKGHLTLAGEHSCALEVKKSRFVATAWPVTSSEQALRLIQKAVDASASHNCFAYRITDANCRASDDGEPSGTAGPPILQAIDSHALLGVIVMVTRHFGGVKLGTGGLVRAYGQAARSCLSAACKVRHVEQVELQLHLPMARTGAAFMLLEQHGATRLAEEWRADGSQLLRLRIAAHKASAFGEALANATSGEAQLAVMT